MTSLPDTITRPATFAGIGMMLLGIMMFAVNDVMGKWLVATYTVGQVLAIRSIAALAVLTPMVARQGLSSITALPHPHLQVARVAFATAEVALFYWVVVHMPLADAMTYWLAAPIWVVIIAALVLRERVDLGRWLAVALGFVGVVIVLNPTAAPVTLPALAAIIGSICFAIMTVMGRTLKATSDVALVFWQNVGALILGLALLPWGWTTPTLVDLALLALLGVVAMVAHMCVTRSLKLAPASVVVPYQYTLIVWAIVFGWIVFADTPTLAMLIGAAVIVGSGLFLFQLEQKAAAAS
jgi:drug/metabolite transporter (DMT)-like permease